MVTTFADEKSDMTLSDNLPADQDHLPPGYSEATDSRVPYQDASLPSFSEPSGSSSSYSTSSTPNFAPLARPTNYVTLERAHSSISGIFAIDPTLPATPGAIQSQDKDGKNLNLRLSSKHGSIFAVIDIIRGPDAKGPARLETNCKHGNTEVTVHDRRQNRFRLRTAAKHGSIVIRLPSTFIGSIRSKTNYSQLRFGTEVQQHVTVLSETPKEGRYFIGDFAAHGYEDDETWLMDHLEIESEHSTVTIKFDTDKDGGVDESNGKGKGFFGRLFSA